MEQDQDEEAQLHVIMFPWLAMGHLIPFLHLSNCLASKGHRLSFISTPKNLSRLPKIPSYLSHLIHLVPIPLPKVLNLPEKAESSMDIPHNKSQLLKTAFDLLKQPVFDFLKNLTPKPDWIIYDYASHWVPSLASELKISCAYFSLFNAANLAFIVPPNALLSEEYARTKAEDFTVAPSWIPFKSNIVYRKHELTKSLEDDEGTDSGSSDMERFCVSVKESDVVLVRTCVDFERDWFNLICELYQKTVVPVGFLPPSLVDSKIENNENWFEIKDWLDKREIDSVVYVALGTEATLSRDEIATLALGLEKSELFFIWVLRSSPGSDLDPVEILPDGFLGHVENCGKIYSDWAPQVMILSHPSIGGFLTHCGWNSIIEGLSFGRIPILFPVMNDQGLNARLMEGKKIGIEIPRNEFDGYFTSISVAKSIRAAMVGEEGETMRANVREMKALFGDKESNQRCVNTLVRFLEEEKRKSE